MLYSAIRDEQPTGDGRLPLGGDSRGASTGLYGGAGAGKCGREYRGVCAVYWEFNRIMRFVNNYPNPGGGQFVPPVRMKEVSIYLLHADNAEMKEIEE